MMLGFLTLENNWCLLSIFMCCSFCASAEVSYHILKRKTCSKNALSVANQVSTLGIISRCGCTRGRSTSSTPWTTSSRSPRLPSIDKSRWTSMTSSHLREPRKSNCGQMALWGCAPRRSTSPPGSRFVAKVISLASLLGSHLLGWSVPYLLLPISLVFLFWSLLVVAS